jgi:Carboxypeptidase regulatory-like domain
MTRCICALVAAILLCGAAPAQEKKPKRGEAQTRSVQGVVSRADDQPVAGAVVQLKNTKTLQIRSFITKENGAYYFHELSPDIDYELTATDKATAESSGTKTLSSFDSRTSAILNLKLNPKK